MFDHVWSRSCFYTKPTFLFYKEKKNKTDFLHVRVSELISDQLWGQSLIRASKGTRVSHMFHDAPPLSSSTSETRVTRFRHASLWSSWSKLLFQDFELFVSDQSGHSEKKNAELQVTCRRSPGRRRRPPAFKPRHLIRSDLFVMLKIKTCRFKTDFLCLNEKLLLPMGGKVGGA